MFRVLGIGIVSVVVAIVAVSIVSVFGTVAGATAVMPANRLFVRGSALPTAQSSRLLGGNIVTILPTSPLDLVVPG